MVVVVVAATFSVAVTVGLGRVCVGVREVGRWEAAAAAVEGVLSARPMNGTIGSSQMR